MTTTASTTDRPPSSKTVLYCFDCGHESSSDGDWNVQSTTDGDRYDCPECGTTITVRPTESARGPDQQTPSCYCT
ncbi:hypothetical protein [Natronorubrum sp. DTA28]|uniref:hypothetical protein n=1 Tax=Natronorubrum sp. DTA28 TaxID=3447019 RepID=UPI003F83652D